MASNQIKTGSKRKVCSGKCEDLCTPACPPPAPDCDSPEAILVENPSISTMSDLGDGTYVHTNGVGVATVINTDPDIDITDNGDGSISVTWANGSADVDICKVIEKGCNASLISNPDGSMVFTDNTGSQTIIPAPPVASLVDNGNGTLTFNDGLNNVTVISI